MAVRGASTSLAAVLGSSHKAQLPLAYVVRDTVQEAFARALTAQTHIAVSGTPGVGKSALVRHNVDWAKVIFVECLSGQQAPDVYRSMLSEAGARIKTETRLTRKKRLSATLKVFSGDIERGTENTETEITIDLGNVGDVFRVLRSRSRPGQLVVLNNFHVLARPVQRRIVGSLQYIYEHTDTRFLIVGNWTSPAYLSDLNSLLPSFVTDVNVMPWSDEELMLPLKEVERLLNISFADDVAASLVRSSVGSVRELMDNCRRLLSASGVLATQESTRVIKEIDEPHEFGRGATARLHERYAALLSSYLTAKLYSAEGVDIDRFLDKVARDLIEADDEDADEDDDDDEEETYPRHELHLALADVIVAFNEPRLAERAIRTRLLGGLLTAVRQPGDNRVSVSLRSIIDIDGAIVAAEQYAFRDSAKKLIRLQADQGFRPPLLAYDPHGGALIAMEPKFRAFLRDESLTLDMLQCDDVRLLDQIRGLGRRWPSRKGEKWHDAIAEAAAAARRRLMQNAAGQ
jgi:hypothetical protein